MEAKIIQFAVRDNNNIFRLELSKALLRLIEFDFTYFWEHCIEAGRIAKKNGRLPQNEVAGAKSIIAGLHPYVEADINGSFSDIVTDCIIEYICHSERIGTEELWVRCIAPKSLYEEAIFKRLSEYKTGKAINQWSNIVKIQEYAKNKVSFIYDCEEEIIPQSEKVLRARKDYFDLAYSIAANELGFPGSKQPSVRVAGYALMPNAAFVNTRVSRTIYRRFSEILKVGGDLSVSEGRDCSFIKDRLAMDAYDYVKGMTRPNEIDINTVIDFLKDGTDLVYMPDSFKAVVDLEFDLMMHYGIVLRKCESCGRYFTADGDGFFCERVNSSGFTCRRQNEIMKDAIAKAAEAAEAEERPGVHTEHTGETVSVSHVIRPEPVTEVLKPASVPPVLEKKGQKIYNALYKRVGKGMEEKEFREWSRYLSDMKRNLKTGEASVEQLEEFLEYSDRFCDEVKAAVKSKNSRKVEFRYPETEKKKADAEEQLVFADSDPEMAHIHVPVSLDDEEEPRKITSAEGAELKPFMPEVFETVEDALAAKPAVKDPGGYEEVISEKSGKKAAVKPPQWKRMTREEAYASMPEAGSGEDDEE